MPHEIHNWPDIANDYAGTLLIGNGASIAVSNSFKYNSILEFARNNNLMTANIERLFDYFNTSDFELILRIVWQSTYVNKCLNIRDNATEEAYINIRNLLIQVVRAIHPEYSDVSENLQKLYTFTKRFDRIISLNYDLILYWVMMYGNSIQDGHRFKDCFLGAHFDCNWKRFEEPYYGENHCTLVFYPHGNLYLSRNLRQSELKLNADRGDLLRSILESWETGDRVPLFVSEGLKEQKISSIQGSHYLETVYRETLAAPTESIVIYGWGFGLQDTHILERLLKSNPNRIAISANRADQAYCNRVSEMITAAFGNVEVQFFDRSSPNCWNN
ncbi:DUF4917 family protein [Pseudomonas aeruginosa]|jgi:hypothetical protein|uniref:DUF4917 family protein n=2 Tax=Pseudomonas aeruginosa TaxID=287 RepID=UPI0009A4E6CE|nr:DUF4917 family protein [Pseudomonas aeruginosa]MBI7317297.1 DUF4917 family protein [Pseudomonas aeruginosa]MBI7329790.1 DUF4917 family protein [Pseudomonas aeruginosa]MBI7495658.1 DUF4917 family protein [Pseudomonas aeruginosa]MCO2874635.1 DUF4917 family protein [Pseudomonas aeruginosa]MDV6816531.1 DUF4917 family protein [Pseudomonas aeruginosa]